MANSIYACLPLLVAALALAALPRAAGAEPVSLAGADWERLVEHAPFSLRDTAEGVVFRDKLWLSNGYVTGGGVVRDLWNSADGLTWTEVLHETPYDAYAEMAVYEGKLWAVKQSVWNSSDGVTWTRVLDQTPFGVRGYGELVAFDGKLWQLGSGTDVWWTTDGLTWTCAVQEAPYGKRYAPVVAAFGGKLWVVGGAIEAESNPPEKHYKQYTTYNDVWCSSDGVNWTRVLEHAPWEQRQWCVGQVYGGYLFILGGFSNRRSVNFDDVWYTADGVTWQELKTEHKFTPRHEITTYDYQGRLWAVAGNMWPLMNDVWRLRLPGE